MSDKNNQTLAEWVAEFHNETTSLRLGQKFVNYYTKGICWGSLYYCTDDSKAIEIIKEHLVNTQHYPFMPPKI